MSSFIGHGLAAFGIGKSLHPKTADKNYLWWQLWLILSALAPDLDYLVPPLNSVHNGGVRITHSIVFSLIFPFFGIVFLFLFDRKKILRGGLQACLAGLSHLLLDALVGSPKGDPFLYPFSDRTFTSSFGVLPSSATISLTNFYFYRNLLIECGILIPVCCAMLYFAGKLRLNSLTMAGLAAVFAIFLFWSISLNR